MIKGAIIQADSSIGVNGKVIVVGVTPPDQTTNLPLRLRPLYQKSIIGNLYGMISTHVDIPRLTHMAMTYDLKLDKLITHKFKLEEINDGVDKMMKSRSEVAGSAPGSSSNERLGSLIQNQPAQGMLR